MPNPNKPNTSSEATDTGETLNQTPRSVNEERGEKSIGNYDKFSHLTHEEILQLHPERLSDEELASFAETLKARISKYEKIIAAAHEKEAVSTETPTSSETDQSETETSPIPSESTDTTETVAETITSEELEQTKAKAREKAQQGFSIKNFLGKKVLPVVLSAAVLIGGLVGLNAIGKDSGNQSNNETPPQTPTEQVQSSGEVREHHGIYDGYYETGEYMSANKATPYDFANAAEVASVVGDDECDVMKEVAHNQVESLADQLACIPDTVKAKHGVSSDFLGGISINETEKLIEKLSDEDYDKLLHQVDQIWDDAFTESVTLNGEYQNAFMRTSATGNEKVTHNNTELVACTTQENGTAATKFYWTVDGNANSARMGDVTAKISRDADGHIAQGEGVGQCTQIVTEVGTFSFLYKGMNEMPRNPNNPGHPDINPPVPDTPPTPPTPPAKWGKSGDPHTGPGRLPSDLVDPNSSISASENAAINQGKQGYVDDDQAAPGSGSENNGTNAEGFSNIITDGADTSGGRASGGEQQGSDQLNGTNANAPTQEQIAFDAGGDAAQNNGNKAGGDNNSNAAEEAAVANGDF